MVGLCTQTFIFFPLQPYKHIIQKIQNVLKSGLKFNIYLKAAG